MKRNLRLAGWLALVGAGFGIIGNFLIFLDWYDILKVAPSAEPGCEILLKYIMPALSDLGILGGVLYAVSAYGFFTAAGWAFPLVVIANVLALQGSWFVNVPAMAAGMPPVYFPVFWPNLALFFLFVKLVGGRSWKRTLLGLLAGMAYIFCLMNSVASTSRIIILGAPIFVLVQRLHLFASVAWGVVTVGILLRPKEWMRVVGLAAGLLEIVVGIPLAVVTAIELERFSLFALAPIICLGLVAVVLLRPAMWLRLTKFDQGDATAETA